jgi:hypothetical protein
MIQTRPLEYITAEYNQEIQKWDELFEFHHGLGFPVPDEAKRTYDGLIRERDRLVAANSNEGRAL